MITKLFAARYNMPYKPNIGQELLNVPMGKMIREMAFAIADAQIKLDENSIEVAQMLGGLKTITDDKGNVTFTDSRVFFGNEKLKVKDAIDLYNASNDPEYRARVLQGLGKNFFDFDCELTTYDSKEKMQTDSEKKLTNVGKIYALALYKEFYLYEKNNVVGTTTTKVVSKVEEYWVPIKRKASEPAENMISVPQRVSMLELGFSPTFYQFVDTIIEVKIDIKYTSEGLDENNKKTDEKSGGGFYFPGFGGGGSVKTTSVNATHSQKYNYSCEGSSLLRTKLVPIPPPAILEERIRMIMEVAKEDSAKVPPENQ